MRVDASIDSRVCCAEAYRLVMWHRGRIAALLREAAINEARWRLLRAESHGCGPKRHRMVKHARDVLRRIRRMEMERSGWR
jgi:hypothetical protein